MTTREALAGRYSHYKALWALILAALTAPVAVSAQAADGTPTDLNKSSSLAELAAPAAISAQTADGTPTDLNKYYRVKGWDIPFPSYQDTILQDYGGWRSTLAKYGFGFTAFDFASNATNLLNTPRSNNGQQAYWGQRPSYLNTTYLWLTYDMSQYGIPDGQIVAVGNWDRSTWQPYVVDTLQLSQLSYYQTLFNKRVELKIGYTFNNFDFVGSSVGQNFASPFGSAALVPVEVGLAAGPSSQPTARVTFHITDTFYNEFAVARSVSPTANALLSDRNANPTGIHFGVPGGRALFIDEVGYKQAAAPGVSGTWLRGGAIYNTSLYHNYATGGQSKNYGLYALADQQIVQVDPSSPDSAYRGIYIGASAMYAPPSTTIFSQYYEVRLYARGLFKGREKDQVSLVYARNVISSSFAALTNSAAAATGVYARHSTNTITASYTARVFPGVYATLGLSYTDNPSVTYLPKEGSSLNVLAGLFAIF
jgi:porin